MSDTRFIVILIATGTYGGHPSRDQGLAPNAQGTTAVALSPAASCGFRETTLCVRQWALGGLQGSRHYGPIHEAVRAPHL